METLAAAPPPPPPPQKPTQVGEDDEGDVVGNTKRGKGKAKKARAGSTRFKFTPDMITKLLNLRCKDPAIRKKAKEAETPLQKTLFWQHLVSVLSMRVGTVNRGAQVFAGHTSSTSSKKMTPLRTSTSFLTRLSHELPSPARTLCSRRSNHLQVGDAGCVGPRWQRLRGGYDRE